MYICRLCGKIFEKPEKVLNKNAYRKWRYQCPACKKSYFKHLNLIVKAILQTKHFIFEAYGDTRKEARKILMEGIGEHCSQYGISFKAFCNRYCEGDNNYITYTDIYAGCAYRDNEILLNEKEPR